MRARRRTSRPDTSKQLRRITVLSWARERHRGIIRCGGLIFPCALGRSGITRLKREGDGASPAGRHRLLCLYYRHDRTAHPRSALPTRILRPNDGWCEDPAHGRYNCAVRLPSAAAHESMWRNDPLYDVVGVLDWNLSPRIRGRGSAIFLHIARPDYAPTAGCIALHPRHLARLLAASGPRAEFVLAEKPRRMSGNIRLIGVCRERYRRSSPAKTARSWPCP